MKPLVVALALGLVAGAALAENRGSDHTTVYWFDWDRYHARQDACAEEYRIVEACARSADWCDELALRQAARDCSPWGPFGERRR